MISICLMILNIIFIPIISKFISGVLSPLLNSELIYAIAPFIYSMSTRLQKTWVMQNSWFLSFYSSAPLPVLSMSVKATTIIYKIVKANSSSDQLSFSWHLTQNSTASHISFAFQTYLTYVNFSPSALPIT